MLKTSIGRLRLVGFAEGISFILLLGVAMPLKYVWQMPQATQVVGMMHGILFIMYIWAVLSAHSQFSWSIKKTGLALLASVIPLGTFYADAKLFKAEVR